MVLSFLFFFFSSRRRHTRLQGDWSSDVCSSDLPEPALARVARAADPATTLKEGGADIEVSFESEHFDLPQAALLGWVSQAARAVSAYYGRFPVPRARVRIFAGGGRGVSHGTS